MSKQTLPALQSTEFGQAEAMSRRRHRFRPIACISCAKMFTPTGPLVRQCPACATITKQCEQCKNPFSFKSLGPVNNAKRRFCCNTCAAKWRNAQPGRTERFNAWMDGKRGVKLRGRKSPESAARMKANNPMNRPDAVAKMRSALTGRTFLARGGNGKPTKPQTLLAEALSLPMEFVIETAGVKDRFESLPHCYKVDLASPKHKLAIEVDGNSHKTKLWKFLDARKTAVLNALGWKVLRFWNQEVMDNPARVIASIRRSML